MIIKDENGKERKAVSIKKITHKISDAVNGGTVDEEFAEVVIDGNRGQWKEWYHLPKFKQLNPSIEI